MTEAQAHDCIYAEVERITKARADAIERACEQALQGGVCGVSVWDDMAMVDPAVPYGQLHHHPSRYGG